jgi:hypothetical protein
MFMTGKATSRIITFLLACICCSQAFAQGEAKVSARLDANKIMVGDQARLFIEVEHNASAARLQWAIIPDTFNKLEIVEKGKIDTAKNGDLATYKQRLLITGFDSGVYTIPRLAFTVIPASGDPYTISTDSVQLLVQTVAVDTTQPFKPIKDIMVVKTTWRDYIWYILGGLVFIILIIYVALYFIRNKKTVAPVQPVVPKETLQQKTLRVLDQLESKQLWQSGKVKEYYTELTDILRIYIEHRYGIPVMELTTNEFLEVVRKNRELLPFENVLAQILYTADLAKFAKAQPLEHEHIATMESVRSFVRNTVPPQTDTTTSQS